MKYTYTYSCPLITVVDIEYFPVESDVNAQIEVFPMPTISHVILGQSLSLDEFSLRNTAVLYCRLHHRY